MSRGYWVDRKTRRRVGEPAAWWNGRWRAVPELFSMCAEQGARGAGWVHTAPLWEKRGTFLSKAFRGGTDFYVTAVRRDCWLIMKLIRMESPLAGVGRNHQFPGSRCFSLSVIFPPLMKDRYLTRMKRKTDSMWEEALGQTDQTLWNTTLVNWAPFSLYEPTAPSFPVLI